MKTNRYKQMMVRGASYKQAKFAALAVALLLGLANGATVYADTGDQWTSACVAGLENNGGRGSNAATAYCGCMAKASDQFGGELPGLLAVMASPMVSKMAVFEAQSLTNKKIISTCVKRVEEVFGVITEQSATDIDQPKGIWGDPDVIEAIHSIDFSASQAKVFKSAATDFSNDLRKATARILRDDSDTRRRVKKTQRFLLKRMDEKMFAVLASNQRPRYQTFSQLLLEKIKESVRIGSADLLDTNGIPGGYSH